MQPRGEGLHRLTIACGYERASIARRRLDRLLGRLPYRRRHRRGGRPHLVCRRCRGGNSAAHQRRPLAPWHAASISSARSNSATSSAAISSAGHVDGIAEVISARRLDRHGAACACARRPRSSRFIAPKGSVALDGVSLTVNAVEGGYVFGAHHSAYAAGDDLRRRLARAMPSILRSICWPVTRARLVETCAMRSAPCLI